MGQLPVEMNVEKKATNVYKIADYNILSVPWIQVLICKHIITIGSAVKRYMSN
jgi:hypothetical protein